ncbi:hypothetical protein K435DRAFT_868254 [Dendrothele bispora CBS 962.96]|uniref:Uncharacterized protein n=1 Tax=Dendrothele bispora (strain CBS 962.96) TaxID=1314807 RepID=A0A4S8LCW7_DENBC|nr:hypothetical protein K435DRAFT_868254 [Dendrothele bispora CBS 962.96]
MDSPRLPIELVEEIVSLFWSDDSLQVSPQDRATFIVSSLFVNRCWSSLFLSIVSRDVYIPSPAFAFHLCDALQFQSQSKSKSKPLQFRTSASSSSTFSLCSELASLMPQCCRSLTFQYVAYIIDSLTVPSSSSPPPLSASSMSESTSSSSSSAAHSQIKPKYTSDLPLHLIPTRLILARQHAIAKFQQTQLEIKLEAREIQREKWRRVGDAGEGWEEVVRALGLLFSSNGNGDKVGRWKVKTMSIMGKSKSKVLLKPGPDMTDDLRARLGEVEEKLARLLSRMESSESDLDVAGRAGMAGLSTRDQIGSGNAGSASRSEGEKLERLEQKITDLRLEKVFLEKWLWTVEEEEKRRAERKLGMMGRGLRRIITRMNVSTGIGLGLWTRTR